MNGSTLEQSLAKYENLHDNFHKLWDAGATLTNLALPKQITAQTMYDNDGCWHMKS